MKLIVDVRVWNESLLFKIFNFELATIVNGRKVKVPQSPKISVGESMTMMKSSDDFKWKHLPLIDRLCLSAICYGDDCLDHITGKSV